MPAFTFFSSGTALKQSVEMLDWAEGTCTHICISRTNRNALSLKWPVIGQSPLWETRFSKSWKQRREEVQKYTFLKSQLNNNMLKGHDRIFAQ